MNTLKGDVLVVEDEAQIRKFVRISLEAEGYTVHETRLGGEGLELIAASPPCLVILDLGLPDMDGQQFLRRVREWSTVPVIVLSVRASETEKVQALDAGANDYVTKPFGISELMARIRVVLRNSEGRATPPALFQSGPLTVDLAQRKVSVEGVPVHLTRKEYDLLHLLISNSGQVMTHQQILRAVWGPGQQEETHYLRVLVRQLRNKLGDEPTRPRFVITVQGVGYRLASSA
ncbi:DNA-binding response regulator [Kineobactrum sediminis]|uniref:DNA-binding response regulator n=1 Tax=Kineobactrum sediminis TaxID=1905677 RepID=A0A2N5Y0W8_9GAMM|nr:response regulator transcription factor [Kineobactrum sediminis]PLW82021.1 DNA-binding response regulator [Kineobactrum sediminis]